MRVMGFDGKTISGVDAHLSQTRLERAAREFEGQMMQELMKPVTEDGGLSGEESDAGLSGGGVLGDFAGEALGQALSRQGGFGIADRIINQLSHSGHAMSRQQGNHHFGVHGGMRSAE